MKPAAYLLLLLLLFTHSFGNEPIPNEQQAITQDQSLINQLIPTLAKRHSSHKAVTAFRITQLIQHIQPDIAAIYANPKTDKSWLRSALNTQLTQAKSMVGYFDNIFSAMVYPIDSPADDPTPLLTMVRAENQNDVYLGIQNKTLHMLVRLGSVDAKRQTQQFLETIEKRANTIIGYLEYSKQELDDYLSIAPPVDPKNPSKQDIPKLLKKRLELTANSLSCVIDILESHNIDTLKYKQALLYNSGEVNTDVFNVHVVASLIHRWGLEVRDYVYQNAGDMLSKLLIFILILCLFYLLARLIKAILQRMLQRSSITLSQLMRQFIITWTGRFIMLIGFLFGLSQLGFNLTPILAGLGIASVLIGFALKETLANVASGILILIYKPYDIGDIITALEVTGVVSHMSLVSTTINSYDNERLVIPNSKIWENKIDNLTAENDRRVDMLFSIHYRADIEHAERVLKDILDRHPKVKASPEPLIKVHKLGNASVDIATRPWVDPYDYWEVYWDVTREVKMRFDEEGIQIPYPQLDVHHHSK